MSIAVAVVSVLGLTLAALGLAIGSFLNVVVHRVPAGVSIVSPPSACPRCHHGIRRVDNIPVLSWVLLRGRCRDCALPISARYPIVEAVTAVLFVVVALRFWPGGAGSAPELVGRLLTLAVFLYLMAISVALALIDLDTHRLPNAIVLPAYPIVGGVLTVAAALDGDGGALIRAVIGMAALGAFYLALAVAVPGGMGLGDVKLAGVVGLALGYLGWGPLAVGSISAFLVGGSFATVLLVTGRIGRKGGIPFGPWILTGLWIGVLAGAVVSSSYLSITGLA